ncbi:MULTISPECIES: MFS transporter [Peribacillus]|uniref:MFS transporter n=1 Tax=Peribacillus castrilensis TaxID=2897690 RepID=A0AAW9NN36_9BACI|nr:MFS transporter [Peribacillus frigoritolerans]MEC0276998.1 MFS transporter [Peribacillus castrilensis]TFH59736.1 MFS transporter [Peribacillus frigoritolerans]
MKIQTKSKVWTKDFFILSLVNFFLTLIFFLLNATITLYALNEFNASTSQAGLVAGIFIIGALIGRLFTGPFMNTIGPKRILMIGLIFFTLTTLLYFMDHGISFLIMSRFVNGITVGIATTVIGTIVALTIPESRRGEGIGYFAVSTALATGLGPFIGLYMSQHKSFDMIFSFSLVLGIISLVTGFFVNIPLSKTTKMKHEIVGFKLSGFIEPKALPIGIIILTMAFCFSGVLSYLNLYAIKLDLVDTASFFFIVYTASVLVSRPFTGRLMDRKGANFIMYPAFILFGVGMLLLSSASNSVTFLLAGALIGFGFGNILSVGQTIAVNLAAPHRMGLATATFFISFDIGNGFGPSLLGLVIPTTGYNALYAILGIVVFATSTLYYFLYGKKERAYRLRMAESS